MIPTTPRQHSSLASHSSETNNLKIFLKSLRVGAISKLLVLFKNGASEFRSIFVFLSFYGTEEKEGSSVELVILSGSSGPGLDIVKVPDKRKFGPMEQF